MSRLERLHAPRGSYFVIDEFRAAEVLVPAPGRTHTEAELWKVAARRAQYEAQLAYAITRWCAQVHTHCWMPGSALLEIQIGWAPLEDIMRSLRGRFSRYVRAATGSPEPVYAGRYKAWLLEPRCALDLRRDICWRPVRAGLCKQPSEYPHTTIQYAFSASIPPFLARSRLLTWFQQRQHHSRAQLLAFLSAAPSPTFSALLPGSPHDRRIIGDQDFVRKIHRAGRRSLPAAPPESLIERTRLLLERTGMALTYHPADTLVPALTAWLASCTRTASVSTAANWFPPWDRSRLERAIDHYMQVRPDLFSERTLRQFVADV